MSLRPFRLRQWHDDLARERPDQSLVQPICGSLGGKQLPILPPVYQDGCYRSPVCGGLRRAADNVVFDLAELFGEPLPTTPIISQHASELPVGG